MGTRDLFKFGEIKVDGVDPLECFFFPPSVVEIRVNLTGLAVDNSPPELWVNVAISNNSIAAVHQDLHIVVL